MGSRCGVVAASAGCVCGEHEWRALLMHSVRVPDMDDREQAACGRELTWHSGTSSVMKHAERGTGGRQALRWRRARQCIQPAPLL